ncbi:MAG: putative monovalent cation/H+ antiporter subunit A [Pseudomonadota bacterium]
MTADPPGQGAGSSHAARTATALALLAAIGPAVTFGSLVPVVSAGESLRIAWQWLPSLGVQLAFRVDGLSLLFALLITSVGALVALYAGTYLRAHPQLARLQLYLVLFMAAMLGLVLADDLITLFVFWELTTITSFLLIGFDHTRAKARGFALQALFVTGAGGLALLAGLLMLGHAAGTFELSAILANPNLTTHPLYLPILILVLFGAFTKSAQFPFHFWLPNAMAAPTPVSAYLHSATMVKAGVYLLARLHPALGDTEVWFYTLTITGAVTAVWASLMALRQRDLKLMLAWTTVMALGTLVMLLGSSANVAIAAAITFLLVHAFYKCSLFLVVGAVDHGTGTREVDRLGGLAGAMPITAAIACIAALSMAGFPPFLGFIGKELKYEGALAIADEPFLIAGAAVAANAMMVSVACVVAFRVFFGRAKPLPTQPHEVPVAMWIGPGLLAGLGLVFGIMPELLAGSLIQPAVSAVVDQQAIVKLALWHGINAPLLLSLLTVVLGGLLFWRHHQVRSGLDNLVARLPFSGDSVYERTLDGLKSFAAWQTRQLQHGALSRYLAVVFAVFAIGVGGVLFAGQAFSWKGLPPSAPLLGWAAVLLVAAATLIVVLTSSRLLAICALGLVGVGSALVFLLYGAVDVAITQLLVETLFVVIIALVLPSLPAFTPKTDGPRSHPLWDGSIAIGCGAVVAALTLAIAQIPVDRTITSFYEQASVPDAHGRNIVNVILVDFRALDTLGEIAVVAIAALGVVALIRLRPIARAAGTAK